MQHESNFDKEKGTNFTSTSYTEFVATVALATDYLQ
jgi:hypothetical protein